ncbi:tRNA pseudouridine synthase 3 [Quaeritorhiza haematococci]|nr:tRNA pseudouridine synthase 3 [Quaeritorhiza haematococci]
MHTIKSGGSGVSHFFSTFPVDKITNSATSASTTRATVGPKKEPPFDFSRSSKRYVALRIAYQGFKYRGFAKQKNTRQTIEEYLWRALRSAKLVPLVPPDVEAVSEPQPPKKQVTAEGLNDAKIADECSTSGTDTRGDPGYDNRFFMDEKLLNFTRSARTDAGVSSAYTVVSLFVRSRLDATESGVPGVIPWNGTRKDAIRSWYAPDTCDIAENGETGTVEMVTSAREEAAASKSISPASILGEFPYAVMLNQHLPNDIRVVAWTPVRPDFSARYACQYREYEYYFEGTAAADVDGNQSTAVLDVAAMQRAASKLVGRHDFRNFCKFRPDMPLSGYVRTVSLALIETVQQADSQVYRLRIRAPSFLWNQVRCIMSVLLLIGRRMEDESVIDALLDVSGGSGCQMVTKDAAGDGSRTRGPKCVLGRPRFAPAIAEPLILVKSHYDGLRWFTGGETLKSFDRGQFNAPQTDGEYQVYAKQRAYHAFLREVREKRRRALVSTAWGEQILDSLQLGDSCGKQKQDEEGELDLAGKRAQMLVDAVEDHLRLDQQLFVTTGMWKQAANSGPGCARGKDENLNDGAKMYEEGTQCSYGGRPYIRILDRPREKPVHERLKVRMEDNES